MSWVLVAALTGVNIFIFLKLKNASEQMMKNMFPGASNMTEALGQMEGMLKQMQKGGGRPGFQGLGKGTPYHGKSGSAFAHADSQLQQAMNMLQKIQTGKKK